MSTRVGIAALLITTSAVLAHGAAAGQQREPQPGRAGERRPEAGQPGGEERLGMMDRRFVVGTALGDMMEIDLAQMALQRASSDGVRSFAQRLVRDHQENSARLRTLAAAKGVMLPTGMLDMNAPGERIDRDNREQPGQRAPDAGSPDRPERREPGAGRGNLPGERGARGQGDMSGMMGEVNRLGLRHMPVEHRDLRMLLGGLSGTEFDQAWINEQLKHHAKTVAGFEFQARHSRDPEVRTFATRSLPSLNEHLRIARGLARLNGTATGETRR